MPITGFEIKNADGQAIVVPDGEYYFNTKARGRRLCKDSLSSDSRRAYACLELATMAFKQEDAVMQTRSGKRYMTQADISEITGLDKAAVARALIELENAGLAKRVPINPDLPLQKGNIKILCWATPQQPTVSQIVDARVNNLSYTFDSLPDSLTPLKAFASRSKLRLPEGLTPEEFQYRARNQIIEAERVARNLESANLDAARFLETLCAPTALNKEERTDRNTEKERGKDTPPPPPQHSNGNGTAVTVIPAPDRETVQRFEQWRSLRSQCKKPVPDDNLELRKRCFELFAGYSPPEQRRIVLDTAARIPSYNAETKLQFIPDGLKYLKEASWRTDPVQHVAKINGAEQDRMDFYRRANERARERDRKDGRT